MIMNCNSKYKCIGILSYSIWTYAALLFIVVLLMFMLPSVVFADSANWPNAVPEANASGRWPTVEEVPAASWIVIDIQTGETIISHNEHEKVFPASTTKIMTAMTVLNDSGYDPNKVLTASAAAVDLSWDSSKIYLQEDETIVMKDAMAGLLLASGNDVANVLAESISGTVEEFSRRMTVEALALGAVNTSFMNPHGLHDENHYTTAYDMALIARAAMKLDIFREIVSAERYSLPASNKHYYNGWNIIMNTNRLMHFDDSYLYSPYIKEIKGIKTGTTSKAGFCLVSAAETHDGRELLSVLMGVPYDEIQGSTWIYSRTLLEEAASQIGSPVITYEKMIQDKNEKPDDSTLETEPEETTVNPTVSENQRPTTIEESSDVQSEDSNQKNLSDISSDSWFWPVIILSIGMLFLLIVIIVQQRKINSMKQHSRRRRLK